MCATRYNTSVVGATEVHGPIFYIVLNIGEGHSVVVANGSSRDGVIVHWLHGERTLSVAHQIADIICESPLRVLSLCYFEPGHVSLTSTCYYVTR